jgi:NADH/NAD ratio-sensing transcriptional regulator Rex
MNPESWRSVGEMVEVALENFRSWVSSTEGRIVGFGAAAKAVTLLSSAQVQRRSISLCIDNSEAKIGKFIPGTHIEIVSEAEYFDNRMMPDDVFLIFPWNLEKEISERIKIRNPNARVFVALPKMKEV